MEVLVPHIYNLFGIRLSLYFDFGGYFFDFFHQAIQAPAAQLPFA
jgi:hypothetical protein